jgi:hypothetical protein
MRSLNKAIALLELAPQIRGTNVDGTASAVATFVGAVRVPCALQLRCSRAANSLTCHLALIEQPNRLRLTAEALSVQQAAPPGPVSLCRGRPRRPGNGNVDRSSHDGEQFRAFDVATGQGELLDRRWQDKSREVRGGRVGQTRRHVRHFARGAIKHDSLSTAATPWSIRTSYTSRASS